MGPEVNSNQKSASRDNHGQNVWEHLSVLCEKAYYGKNSVYIL